MKKNAPRTIPRIRADPIAMAVFAILFLTDPSAADLALIPAIACHEAGHLIAARMLQIPIREIRFSFLGARIVTGDRLLSYGDEWLLAAAGPLAGLLCSAAAAPLWGCCPGAVRFSAFSLILSLLNLLPIRTFDGGRMLSCTLAKCFPERLAGRILDGCSFLFLFLLWSGSVYTLLRYGTGISRLAFSMSLFPRFFDGMNVPWNEKTRENERKSKKKREKAGFL